MIRTQVSLDDKEYKLVKDQARAMGISIAEVIRRAIRDALPADEKAPWMAYAGLVETGDSESSQNIDEIIYGHKD